MPSGEKMPTANITEKQIWEWLNEIPDPEIPVINVVELGVVRNIVIHNDDQVTVEITPTYSGCPALKAMEQDIYKKLHEKGISKPIVKTILSPAWTTDWLSEETKLKLKNYGIAPPPKSNEKGAHDIQQSVPCPFCGSSQTRLQSQFGSTACKALYYCDGCMQPFEHFKCL
jgi:ring-1,2-phenylacetyl-CoA epoxidase subunit PaaD